MKIIKFLLLVICFVQETSAQKVNIMATYAHSDLIYSPGFEINYFFNDSIGFQAGISTLLFNYKPNQMANQAHTGIKDYNTLFITKSRFMWIFLNYKKLKIGWTAGVKLYYGPEFIPLHYYEQGYYIYFDSSGTDLVGNKFDLGADMGGLLCK